MIVLPVMSPAQEAVWVSLMDLHERLPHDWTLVGGQMVHLWCAERGRSAPRPTDDADAVVDVRSTPQMFLRFTSVLKELGFEPLTSGDGLHHRWVRSTAAATAQLDVMVPDGAGRVAVVRVGAGGAPTLETPGGTQALQRTESVEITVAGRSGWVRRPTLVGALVMKAAAHTRQSGSAGARHRWDFAVLLSLLAGRDLRGVSWSPSDRRRLTAMITAVRDDRTVMGGEVSLREVLDLLSGGL